MRLIDAERFFAEIVAGGSVSTRPASHADVLELAAAALPFQVFAIAQFIKDDRVFPDIGEHLLLKVACQRREVATGIDFTLMREETYSGPGQAALSHGVHVGRMTSRMSHSVSY